MTEPDRKTPGPPADPTGIEEPHDVLAAEEFGIGTRDQRFPADPTGIREPHDVLAAEEFAMPAPDPIEDASPGLAARIADLRVLVLIAAVAGAVLVALRRRG